VQTDLACQHRCFSSDLLHSGCEVFIASFPLNPAAAQAARYNISGYDYVLDDLENGILRGNKPGAASIGMLLKLPGLSRGPFRDGDPRAKHVSQHV